MDDEYAQPLHRGGGGSMHLVLGLAEVFPRVREWIDEKTGVARRYGDARE